MVLGSPVPIVTVDMSYVDALVNALQADDAIVALARRYHNGDQDVYMSDRVKEFLDLHPDQKSFCLNICRTIVLAVKDELNVSGFNTNEQPDAQGLKTQAEWAWNLWMQNHMNSVQAEVHESGLADRETFVIVEWDPVKLIPTFTHNYRYTSTADEGGDGQGCWMVYENDDPNQSPVCAVKQWIQTTYDEMGVATIATRRTLYYPDRIEKWINSGGSWQHWVDPNPPEGVPPEPWPIPWFKKDGTPMGISAIHFRNVGMMPEAWDAIPPQDAINKTLVDILASNDLTAFNMLVALGWYPTTDGEPPKQDGSNLLKVGPGQFIGTRDPNAKLDVIKGSDASSLMNNLSDLIMHAAIITSTPVTRFTTTKLVAAAETLKEQDEQLKKKAKDRRVLFGDAWVACISMARAIANVYGAENLDETVAFTAIWEDNETLDDLEAKKLLGVPEETLWSEAGYTSEQIANMKKTDEHRLKTLNKLSVILAGTPALTEIVIEILKPLGINITPESLKRPEPEPEPEGDNNNTDKKSESTNGVKPGDKNV